jgi:hypothetical protein
MKKSVEILTSAGSYMHFYDEADPIWNLPEEKRKRQAVADIQRELLKLSDELSQTPYQIRG